MDILNGNEVGHEDIVMKLFVHSLIEDARDWFRRLPDDSIKSWNDLEALFKGQYGDKMNAGLMLNNFKNIKKNPNELSFEFNVRFQKGMYTLFQVMRLNEDVCLTTYFNAFDSKMAYVLRDKDPKILREAYTMVVNIENNRREAGKLGKRDDPKLFNPRNKKEIEKLVVGKKPKDDTMGKVLSLLKKLNPHPY